MSFNLKHPGRDVIEYWGVMLGKYSEYGPSCDHEKGLAVLAYIDALLDVIAEREEYTKRLSETITFNREVFDRQLADMRKQRNDARARANELDEALSDAEHRLSTPDPA